MADEKDKKKSKFTASMFDDKSKALDYALALIEKQFGRGSIMRLGDKSETQVDVTPTGSLNLDIALGVGGLPRGRIVEIYGPESSGKTTATLHMIAEMQKVGGTCAFVDAEHALDPVYAGKLGVDISNLYISQPDDGEQALDITETMVRSGAIDLVVVDSVAALVPRAEIEGDMGDSHMGLHARLMSQALRKLTAVTSKSKCTVIFINQLRDKIGVMYGSSETTTGGRALKFYASIRIDIRRGDPIKQGADVIGNRTRVKIAKNKVAPPFKTCEFDIIYGEGISKIGDILDVAADIGVINKSGSWYSYNETRIGQGRENAKTFLVSNPEIALEVENAVRNHFNLSPVGDNKSLDKPKDSEKDDKAAATKKTTKKTATSKAAKEKVLKSEINEDEPLDEPVDEVLDEPLESFSEEDFIDE